MRKSIITLGVLFSLLILSPLLYPQEAQANVAKPALERKAEIFVKTFIDQEYVDGFVQASVEQIAKPDSFYANHKNEVRDIIAGYITPARLQKISVAFFAQNFNERELDDLIVFYRSDVGKKWLKISPNIVKVMVDEMQDSQAYYEEKFTQLAEKIRQDAGC